MSKTNDLLPIVRALYLHMERHDDASFYGFARSHLGEIIAHAEAVESGRVDSYCPECGDLYCRCDDFTRKEPKTVCRYCGEIPEDCTCSRGGSRFLDTADMNREEK